MSRNSYSSNWNQLLSGPAGCSGSYYSLGESTLKGYGVSHIRIEPAPENLYLFYKTNADTSNQQVGQHSLHPTSDDTTYTSNDPFSYTFVNTDLIINFTEISYTYTCADGGNRNSTCDKGTLTAKGHACCYFTRKSDS